MWFVDFICMQQQPALTGHITIDVWSSADGKGKQFESTWMYRETMRALRLLLIVSLFSAATCSGFFGRCVTILVGDTRRMEVKQPRTNDKDIFRSGAGRPFRCIGTVNDDGSDGGSFSIIVDCFNQLHIYIDSYIKRMYAGVCAPRASLFNQTRWEERKKRLGMRITFITIYSTYTLNLMVLLIFLNCWYVFFVFRSSVPFGSVALVRCPSSMHCRHLRVPRVHDIRYVRCAFFVVGFFLFLLFVCFFAILLLIYGKSMEPLKWCAYNSIVIEFISILCAHCTCRRQ